MVEHENCAPKPDKNGVEIPNAEVTESDPCMDYKMPKRPDGFLKHAEDVLMTKTGLDRRALRYAGASLVLIVVLFVIIVVLSAVWPRTPHYRQFPVCERSSCLRAAAQIREGLNSSLSPCTETWHWACGGWLSENHLPEGKSLWDQKQQLVQQEAVRIREMVTTWPYPLYSTMVEWKLKHLYDACLDTDIVNTDDATPLMSIITSELGGWNVLRNWNIQDFDGKVTLKDIHVKYGASPYFKISVEPNPQFPGHSSITISPAGLGLPHKSYYYAPQNDHIQESYKELIHDVVISLGVTRNAAEKFGNDMFHYEKRIAEITPDSFELQNPIKTHNWIKVSELKDTVPTLPLQDILMAMYPESNVTEETEVVITSPEYLSQVSQIVASTDRATLNNYIIWTFVRKYLPYLSTKFEAAVDSFQRELFGFEKSLTRWEKCVHLIREVMGVSVDAMLQKRYPITNDAVAITQDVFVTVKDIIAKKLDKFKSMPDLYRHLKSKISNLKLQIAFPSTLLDDAFLKSYYKTLFIMKADLFKSVRNGFSFLKKAEERKLMNATREDFLLPSLMASPPRVRYVPSENTVVVPRVLLSEPLFEDDYPRAVVYGRLGVEIADAVTAAIFPHDSSWTSSLKLLSPFHVMVNESVSTLEGIQRCLQPHLPNEQLIAGYFTNRTSFAVIKHLIAVNIAREALEVVSKKSAHVHQPSLEMFEDEALFFISYAQSKCSVTTKQQDLYDNVVNFMISQKSLLNVAATLVPRFLPAFDCAMQTNCGDMF